MVSTAASDRSASYTIAEAAALTGLHKNTIRLRVKLGQLEAQVRQGKFGEEYRITHAALVRAGLIEGVLDAAESPLGELVVEPPPEEEEAALAPARSESGLPAAVQGSLAELFQRHEQAMFRLGFMQSEMDRLKALAENAESLRQEQTDAGRELDRLRRQLDDAREQARAAETLRRELEQARERLQAAEDMRRLLAEMEQETSRLRAAVEASQQRKPWWKRLAGSGSATPSP
jgi:hypothetical protein